MAHAVAVPSPSSAMKRRRKEEVYRLAYINCVTPMPFRNIQNIPVNSCLEEKSIADLITEQKTFKDMVQNPFEVVRKPPKKRKKVEESCFVNEALNLSQPEKQFNPYEVPRTAAADFEKENHSFVNPALNLKAPDHTVLNPFEIVRPNSAMPQEITKDESQPRQIVGIENPALDVKLPIAIAVPFTPTINHRIDFGQLKTPEPPSQSMGGSSSQLTPSEMLSKKLVFSPKEQNCGTPKRLFAKSLSMISEEATVDIDEELDCYQLQLENSINEAKLNNRKYFTDIRKDVLKKTVAAQKTEEAALSVTYDVIETQASPGEEQRIEEEKQPEGARVLEVVEPKRDDDDGGDFEVVDDDSFDDDLNIDNGNYQPFKRAYVRPVVSQPNSNAATDLMPPPASVPAAEGVGHKPKTDHHHHDGLKGMIRRSIRMITKPKSNKNGNSSKEEGTATEGKSHSDVHVIMSSIRRSLRKRKCRPEDYPAADNMDMSVIIDGSRSVFKDPAVPSKMPKGSTSSITSVSSASSNTSNDKVSGHYGPGAATAMIRNSIRRGKNNIMKNILHKKLEDYNVE